MFISAGAVSLCGGEWCTFLWNYLVVIIVDSSMNMFRQNSLDLEYYLLSLILKQFCPKTAGGISNLHLKCIKNKCCMSTNWHGQKTKSGCIWHDD